MRSWVGLGVVIVLTLAGCGGGPDSSSPGEVSQPLLGDPRVLTLNISGPGTITGSYTTGSGNVAIFGAGCSAAVCTATVPEGAAVTLTGAGPNFIGFQRPYCDVNTCNWDDPEFAPPTQYVWSKSSWTFVLSGAKTVIAKFGPATAPAPSTYALSLALSGSGTVSVRYAVGTAVTNLTPCSSAACSYSIPVNAAVTLTGGANFLGFQRPYCDVNTCDWSDPEFAPPQQYAWSTAPWTFVLAAPMAVNAKFGTLPPSPPVTVALTVNVSGTGTIAASYAVGASVTTLNACNQPTCTYNIPVKASVTLSGSGSTFTGFQRLYCEVNTCNWNDPEFAPPTQYAWSTAPWSFVLAEPKAVNAKFTPPPTPVGPTYLLTLYVYGTGTLSVSYAAGTTVTTLAPCGAASCTYPIPTYASVTVAAASGSFMGFQRPYCDVNPCSWDDPEWMPPTQNALSTAPWTFVLAAPKSVNAKFAPAVCSGNGVPGGTCSATPSAACAYDKDCPTGQTCVAPTPRFVDNGDLTVTDRRTCLVWEKKTGTVGHYQRCTDATACPNPHDVNNVYTWSGSSPWTNFDGTAATVFLRQLNDASFAGHTDWRLPTSAYGNTPGNPELESLLLAPCATSPCIDSAFGPTAVGPAGTAPLGYWSSSSWYSSAAICAYFLPPGGIAPDLKSVDYAYSVRAVRGGP